jgi:hypothetical protein
MTVVALDATARPQYGGDSRPVSGAVLSMPKPHNTGIWQISFTVRAGGTWEVCVITTNIRVNLLEEGSLLIPGIAGGSPTDHRRYRNAPYFISNPRKSGPPHEAVKEMMAQQSHASSKDPLHHSALRLKPKGRKKK